MIPRLPLIPTTFLSNHGLRLLIATIALISALAYCTYLLIDGYKLTTTEATSLSDSDKTHMLDKYNSYSGGIASIVGVPFQQLVGVLVPVFFLCYSTKAFLNPDQTILSKISSMAFAFALTWTLGQGFNALNVQWDTPSVEYIIVSTDLTSSDASSGFDFSMTNVTNSAAIAGILSTDTILRGAIRPTTASSETNCAVDEGGVLYYSRNPAVQFGFPLTSWLEHLMSESASADRSFSFGMSTEFQEDIDASLLLSGDANSTAVLLSYGMWAAWNQFNYGHMGNIETIYNAIYSQNVVEMLTNVQTKMANFSTLPEDVDTVEDSNFSMPDASFSLDTFDLSPQITFEAVTLTLPIKSKAMQFWFDYGVYSGAPDSLDLDTADNCNDHACVLRTPGGMMEDHVRMLPLCMTDANGTDEAVFNKSEWYSCDFQSNTSVLLLSLSRYLTADEINVNNTKNYFGLKNARLIRQVTVGRLSWKVGSLAAAFGAACAADGDCNGLYFPLGRSNQHLIVGEEFIPKPRNVYYPDMISKWQMLATADTQLDSTAMINLIYPPNYRLADGSDKWRELGGENCTSDGNAMVNDILQRHMYSTDSVQSAYTAGLFWLFQNAAAKDIDASNLKMLLTSVQLDFKGSRIWLSSRVTIPRTSAFITFGGCVVALFVGILVVCGTKESNVDRITNQLTAHNVVGMRVGSTQYPALIVGATVQSSADKVALLAGEDISEYDIAAITSQHRTNELTKSVEIVCARPHSTQDSLL